MKNATQFEIGKTYLMGWIGDSELKTPFTVVGRTAKFVTLKSRGENVRCKIEIYDGSERCSPTGKYSMSPVLCANKVQPETVTVPTKKFAPIFSCLDSINGPVRRPIKTKSMKNLKDTLENGEAVQFMNESTFTMLETTFADDDLNEYKIFLGGWCVYQTKTFLLFKKKLESLIDEYDLEIVES